MADRYRNISVFRDSETNRKYRTNPIYPFISESENDLYFISTEGDRYDLLANTFYGNPKLWWIIASANNATTDNLAIQPGIQIRIPFDKNRAITLYQEYNELR